LSSYIQELFALVGKCQEDSSYAVRYATVVKMESEQRGAEVGELRQILATLNAENKALHLRVALLEGSDGPGTVV